MNLLNRPLNVQDLLVNLVPPNESYFPLLNFGYAPSFQNKSSAFQLFFKFCYPLPLEGGGRPLWITLQVLLDTVTFYVYPFNICW